MPPSTRLANESPAPAEAKTPTTNGTKPPRTRNVSPAVKAAILYNHLTELEAAEKRALAEASPARIRARFKAKRAEAIEGAPPEVMKLVEKLRAPESPEPPGAPEPPDDEDEGT